MDFHVYLLIWRLFLTFYNRCLHHSHRALVETHDSKAQMPESMLQGSPKRWFRAAMIKTGNTLWQSPNLGLLNVTFTRNLTKAIRRRSLLKTQQTGCLLLRHSPQNCDWMEQSIIIHKHFKKQQFEVRPSPEIRDRGQGGSPANDRFLVDSS